MTEKTEMTELREGLGVAADRFEILLLPSLVKFLDLQTLTTFPFVCKAAVNHVNQSRDEIGYWLACCHAFVHMNGLFMRPDEGVLTKSSRKYFFDELWIAKHKWQYNDENDVNSSTGIQTFKIKVSCRFRPGSRGHHNMCLPLHQFLKVRREARAKEKSQLSESSDLLVGEADPVEYLDPFLGYLMREPVLLLSSGKICERAVAVQCIIRGGKDPFNNERLTREMIIPQVELSSEIAAWKVKKGSVDVSVGVGELKSLIEGGAIDPELLDALMEAANLSHISKRAKIDANLKNNTHYDNNGDEAGSAVFDDDMNNFLEVDLTAGLSEENAIHDDIHDDFHGGFGNKENNESNFNSKFSTPKNATARVIDLNEKVGCASLHVPGTGVKQFHFSNLYDGESSQSSVYSNSASDSVVASLNGYNSCILCYGQTGSGKTYTSFGPEGALDKEILSYENIPESAGITVRACLQLLRAKELLARSGVYVSLSAQFVEIYDEKVTDLLTGKPVTIRRDTGDLAGVSEANMNGGISDVMNILRQGQARKRFAATAMNDKSSRSHTALIIQITQTRIFHQSTAPSGPLESSEAVSNAVLSDPETLSHTTEELNARSDTSLTSFSKMVKSQLHIVDLAGSERVKKSKATGVLLREAAGINSSLLVLGKVIAALVESQHHVPYLESKLTTMLKGAFGGNSRTTAIVTCRSDDTHGDETLQSMRFGERCGMINNTTKLAATSLHTAMENIDTALNAVSIQLKSLESRGKQHLESYRKLYASFHLMQRKRDDLARSFSGSKTVSI